MESYKLGRVEFTVRKINALPTVTMKLKEGNEDGLKFVQFTASR